MSEIYRIVERNYDNVDLEFHDSYDTAQEYAAVFKPFLDALGGGAGVLVVGGSVSECRNFVERGHKVTNVDISEMMVRHVAENLPTVTSVHANVTNWSGGPFDVVWACRSLIHIPPGDLVSTLAHIGSLLRSQAAYGFVFFEGDQPVEEQQLPEMHATADDVGYYRVLYSRNELESRMAQAGFTAPRATRMADKDGDSSLCFVGGSYPKRPFRSA